ncbi:PML-RARA-regulated adapter molecule 1 isoform X2 [Phyllostomus discolor]|uniref:PML-RARA-regulated adapter molecule 1 n=1 Tax=Phyllostomus discolor TaxID=89673 RepID=A0A6J2MAU7_9CHIR|nr:PML-RARA-regulated adapter molecule 1 isoform X2 [Phyllostomus discolor]
MGSHQDFRSLQAKFQASQPGISELSPKPEFKKLLKKFPQPEPSEPAKKSLQLEFTDLPKKPPQPEFSEVPKKPPQPEFVDLPKKPPQPEFADLPKKPSKSKSCEVYKKFPQLEATAFPGKPPQPGVSETPQKALQLEPSALAQKPLQPDLGNPTRPPTEHEFSTSPRKVWQPELSEATPKPPKPEFSTLPKKPPHPEFSGFLTKPQQPQVPPRKPEPSEPRPSFSQPDLSASPKKTPPPQLSDLPKKPLQPEFGDLTRTSSEPEVCVIPKRPRQSEFKVPAKPLQHKLGSLPRTSSEPEVSLLPPKFLQPGGRGTPRKFSQPEPNALLKKTLQAEFFGDPTRKPPLPGSVSESSLLLAVVASSPRSPLSPGFGARQQRSVLTHSRASKLGLKPSYTPRQRPLPPVSSLGPPPVKPPRPPGLKDVLSSHRPAAAATALRRARSSAGIHFWAPQPTDIQKDPEIYELYDDVEATESSPSPKGKDEVPSIQQPPKKPPQDPELRKEKALQPQQLLPVDPKALKQIRKAEKAEREFRKKFKFEGEIVIQTRMMIDPNAKTRRGGGKHLGIRRGEILEVIEFTNKEEMLCRDTKGKYGYVPRIALLPLETEVYDDVAFLDPLEGQPFPRGQ